MNEIKGKTFEDWVIISCGTLYQGNFELQG
jgi:hypothetical protein